MTGRTPSGPAVRLHDVARLALALAIAGAGGAAADAAGLPAGWLSGAMIAVGLAALSGLSARMPRWVRDLVFLLLGITMGAGVTPDVIGQLPAWPITLAALGLTVVLVTAASYTFLRRVAGWDAASAYFGSIPGALTMTIAAAETSPADMRLVSLSQTMRLFMLVAVLPLVVTAVQPLPPSQTMPVVDDPVALAGLIAAGLAGAAVGVWTRFPSGLLLGAFLASSVLHGAGIVEGQLPPEIQVPSFVALGAMLGLRFSGTGFRQLAGMLLAVAGAFVVAMTTATLCAVATAAVVGMPAGQITVAFAPGGLEAMVILAFVLNLDPAFVAAHHLARFLAMSFAVPALGPLVYGRPPADATKDKG